MDKQLQEIYDNAEKSEACEEGLNWLSQFDTFEKAKRDEEAPRYFLWYAKNVIKGRWELGEKVILNSRYKHCYERFISNRVK